MGSSKTNRKARVGSRQLADFDAIEQETNIISIKLHFENKP